MTRVLVAAAVLLTALGAVSGASAAEKRAGGHHYFWIEAPPAQQDQACQARDLWSLINRGDLCRADDAPTSPPLFTP